MAANSGDVCPRCGRDRLRTRTSKQCGCSQVRYLECKCCGHSDKSVVPAERVFRSATVKR